MAQQYYEQARRAVQDLLEVARLSPGDIVVVGCSTSEVGGHRLGTASVPEVGVELARGILAPLAEAGLFLAAQCCEHLDRVLIVERDALARHALTQVNVVPQPKAGGSFATAAYGLFAAPVAVEAVQAAAGIDIGGTLIGMHLRQVAVPVRLSVTHIGEAPVSAARTRPKLVGGSRAVYDESLL